VLEQRWAAWFDGMKLTANEDGGTTLLGPLIDQAALHGVLQRLRDLGIPLIAVTRYNPPQHVPPRTQPTPSTRLTRLPSRTQPQHPCND
jgi:hypothetical protein